MAKERIPVASEPVDDCSKCNPSACCLGNTIMQLTDDEANFMRTSGNALLLAVPATEHFRKDAPYPIGYGINPDMTAQVFVEEGRETEPLEAGYGRYILLNNCTNLEVDLLGRTSCAQYANRPEVCRTFTPGQPNCHKMQMRRDASPGPHTPGVIPRTA